jgi:diguanylate cyclase (GGDEF)-like protein
MRGTRERDELQQRLQAASRQIAQLQAQLQAQTGRDPLTGLLELTPFMSALGQELARAGRYGRPVSVVRVDIDSFEAVNIEYGRGAGDRVLAAAAQMVAGQTRAQDIVCRVAGDQFALLLPETDSAGAAVCAERILGVLERLAAEGLQGLRASAGVAPFERGQSAERLFASAGAALRQAQEQGGGRVALSSAAGAAEYVRGDAALALMPRSRSATPGPRRTRAPSATWPPRCLKSLGLLRRPTRSAPPRSSTTSARWASPTWCSTSRRRSTRPSGR